MFSGVFMEQKRIESNLKYLKLLANDYPNTQAAAAEIERREGYEQELRAAIGACQ